MDKLTCDLRGVAVYLDDILVSGKNDTEHLGNLRALFQRCDAEKRNVVLHNRQLNTLDIH